MIIRRRTIETKPDGTRVETIEYAPEFRGVPESPVAPKHEPCMFDSLPPGTYGLVCPCPRCSPQYSTHDRILPIISTTSPFGE
jgi:hypothetical protein